MPASEEKYNDLLRTAQPSWQKDNKGIKGDVVMVSHTKANLVWESKEVTRRPNTELGDAVPV